MSDSIPADLLVRYFQAIEAGCLRPGDWEFVEESLDRHAELARARLPSGELPLRMLLRHRLLPGLFVLLASHGAEHDVITACAAADLEAVERLLQADPQRIRETDEEGNTPLHWASAQSIFAQQPHDPFGLIETLVAAGSDVDARNQHGLTPLHRSLLDGNGEACEPLLEHGATPNVLYGVVAEDFELLDDLLEREPQQVHWRDPRDGLSLLHLAVRWECERAIFEYLVGRGAAAELHSQYGRAAMTPLLLAIDTHRSEAAEALIAIGGDVNAREHREDSHLPNRSALEMAVAHDHVGLTELLIAGGADSRQHASLGRTLLCLARSEEMAELLIRSGTPCHETDDEGCGPLDYAVEEGRRDVARALIRHGAVASFFHYVALGDCVRVGEMLDRSPALIHSFHRPGGDPRTPHVVHEDAIEIPFGSSHGTALHYAVKSGVLRMVELVLDRGASVNATTEPMKWTALHDATYYTIYRDLRYGEPIIRMLVQAGADLDARTWGGYRPLDIADYLSFRDRSAEIFDLLLALKREH